MTFSDIVYNDPNKPDPTRQLLREYSLYNRKANKAIETERKAHPWWTLASGIASSFVPFGLGAWITPTADYMVQEHKKQIIDKQNAYRSRLGLQTDTTIPSSGLDLGGIGYGMGSTVATGLGRDVMPGGEKTLSTIGGDAAMLTSNTSSYMPVTTSSQNLPTAPQAGQGQQTLNLPPSTYWDNAGGGATNMYAVTSNGDIQGAQTSATYQHGGKVEAPSHEEGGAPLVKDGKNTGFEIEGEERIVNKEDWSSVISFLKKGKHKSALLLLNDIDKRKPKEKKFERGGDTEFTSPNQSIVRVDDTQTEYVPDQNLDFSTPQTPYFAGQLPFELGGNTYNKYYDAEQPAPAGAVTNSMTVSETPSQTTVTDKQKFNPNFDFRDIVGYGYDAARLGLGIGGSMTPLPQWQIPQDWSEYKSKAKYLSNQGILPESEANAKRYADANYAAAVRDVVNASGGNAAAVLANLGKINAQRAQVESDLAEVDSKLKAANLRAYQGTLLKDIDMKKEIFDMQRGDAMRTKQAGAELMKSAIADTQGRSDMSKFYGKGSYFSQLQEEQLKQGKSLSDIYAMQLDVLKNPEKYPSVTANLTESDKKIIGDQKAIAELEKLVNQKEDSFAKVLAALGADKTISKTTSTTKRK